MANIDSSMPEGDPTQNKEEPDMAVDISSDDINPNFGGFLKLNS